MTTVSTTTLQEALSGVDDVTLRDDYSGRGMYGATCFGIDADGMADVIRFFIQLAQIDGSLAEDLADRLTTDSMGRGIIAYFPGYTLDERLPDGDEEWV